MYYIPKLPTELASLRRGSEHLGNTTLFTPIVDVDKTVAPT